MKRPRIFTLLFLPIAISCGIENALDDQHAELAAECGDDCVDPAPVAGMPATGGGAGVGTSSTAAAAKSRANARRSACAAAKVGLTPPACPDPVNCTATSTITCTYANEMCPVVGTFGATPGAWVAACQLSSEPAAWKAANCNRRTGPAGLPSFVLCTVDATATASTDCEPKSKTCDDEVELERAYLTEDAAECTTTHCDPTTDSKLASGRGTAIDTTSVAASAIGLASAKIDAQLNAAAKLVIPACIDGCKPFGAPLITYTDLGGSCSWVDRFDHFTVPPTPGGQPDTNPVNGIGDWWTFACERMANRNMQDRCDQMATATAKPWGVQCFASARADGMQLCVDSNSTCMVAGATAFGTSSADGAASEP